MHDVVGQIVPGVGGLRMIEFDLVSALSGRS
jgi:hypothetical protein